VPEDEDPYRWIDRALVILIVVSTASLALLFAAGY
jgi:hypothetical protein